MEGDPWIKKVVKVKWDHCTLPQQEGGLGITNIQEMVDRMATKWIVRGLQNPKETWAILLFRNMKKFTLKGKPKWDNLPDLTIWASKYDMAPKGSPLSVSIWKSWFKLKKNVKPTDQLQKCLGSHERDSIWWPTLIGRPIDLA